MEYNEKLKELRVKNNMSQEQLAEQLHVTRQTVSKWEQGINQPDIYTLKQYSTIFNVSLDELIGESTITNTREQRYKRTNKVLFLTSTLLFVFSVISILVMLRFLQDIIPAHYNSQWQIDRYGSKNEVLIHLMAFALYYAIVMGNYLILKNNSNRYVPKTLTIVLSVMLAIQFAYEVFALAMHWKYIVEGSELATVVSLASALLMTVAIATHPKISGPNTVFGVRTNFTLGSVIAWNKVNTVGSICLTVASAAMFTLNMIFTQQLINALSPLTLIVAAIVIIIYHEILRKQLQIKANN